jgi:hypothetical protein
LRRGERFQRLFVVAVGDLGLPLRSNPRLELANAFGVKPKLTN